MSTWKDRFTDYINELHQHLPENATLQDRIQYLRENIPTDARIYSHGRKSWQAARRSYLSRYGYQKQGLPESPLERLIRRNKSNGDAIMKASKDRENG